MVKQQNNSAPQLKFVSYAYGLQDKVNVSDIDTD